MSNPHSTHLSILQLAQPRFHGLHSEPDLLRISHDGKKIIVRGTASIAKASGSRRVAFLLKDGHSSRTHVEATGQIEFLAVHYKTNDRVLVRGVIEKVLKDPMRTAPKNKGMTNDEYADELKRVQSARISQIDALVNSQFIARHTGRAVSSIYRDIKNGLLPKAIKQGGSSRWSFAAVEAYAHGKAVEPLTGGHE